MTQDLIKKYDKEFDKKFYDINSPSGLSQRNYKDFITMVKDIKSFTHRWLRKAYKEGRQGYIKLTKQPLIADECICNDYDGKGVSTCGCPCPVHTKSTKDQIERVAEWLWTSDEELPCRADLSQEKFKDRWPSWKNGSWKKKSIYRLKAKEIIKICSGGHQK